MAPEVRMRRLLLSAALVAVVATGCGGRTGLGVFIDGGGIPEDASGADGQHDGAAPDDGPARDGGGREDAATGKNCAQVMMCVFDSLSAGFDWQAMLACTQGATIDGLSQGGSLIWCLAQNCATLLMSDGGGQFDILMCLMQSCQPELCACEGIDDLVPPGILYCP